MVFRMRTLGRTGLPLAAAALLAAACSSSGHGSAGGGAASSGTATSAAMSGSAGGGVSVRSAHTSAGTALTDGTGRALYLFLADSKSRSACSGSCATYWPPLTTTGQPTAGGGAHAADLGTITRPDGSKQVTYAGHPLYYFAGDTKAGQTTGQGLNNYGAKWWLVAPSGQAITTTGGAAKSSSGGGGYGGGY